MPDIKFSCPHCEQRIAADSGYGGMQISCPGCNGGLIVPETEAPAPPPAVELVSSAPAGARLQPQVSAPAASGCPSCGAALARGAVLCINCGYNLSTGKRIVAGQSAPLGKPTAPQWETPWYKTGYPYVGVVFAVLGVGYALGRDNPKVVLALVGIALLYWLTVHLIVLIAAFRSGVGTGFLCLCIPLYVLYFVFKVHDNDTLKVLYGGVVLINIGFRILGAAMK